MRTLVLLLLMAPSSRAAPNPPVAASSGPAVSSTPVQAAALASGTAESSKIRLDAQDAAGALADAETAVANGGGADAYAARADAKRALGRPMEAVIADYAEAANRDPRYIEKYKGLIVQSDSATNPDSSSKKKAIRNWANVIALIIIAFVLLRGRDGSAAPKESEAAGEPQSKKSAVDDKA